MSVDLDREILRLRTALRDLVALFSVPAVWVDREPADVVEGIADALVGLSQADFVFVRLCDSAGAVEVARGDAWADFREWLEHHLLTGDRPSRAQIVPDVGCDGDSCCGFVVPIGVDANGGLVAVASSRVDFPTEVDQLLLSLAANHAATAFQNARLIDDRKRAEEELRATRDELAREQAALRQVATLVARESSPRQLFVVAAEQVARIIDVLLVRLVRFEPDGSAVELIGGWGASPDPLAVGTRWQLDGPGVLASVWQSRQPARLDDYTDVPGQAAAVVRKAGMRSAIASPITVEGRLWGAIAVLSPRHEPLAEDTEARLAGFTELLATAIANADSRLALARLADVQAALRRVATLVAHGVPPVDIFSAVAEEVGRVLDLPIVALVCYEPDGSAIDIVGAWSESTFPVPIGTRLLVDGPSVIASVWQTGRPARTDDSTDVPGEIAAAQRQAGLRSNIASPILVEGRLWGAMGAGSPERLPDEIELRLMEFTELVATAIANSEARDDLRRLVDEQAALRRVATLVAESASADEVFSSVAREVAHVFAVRLVTICRYESDAVIVLASLGVPEFPASSRWPLDIPGLPLTIHETGRRARIDDFSAAVGLDALAREGGVRAAVGVPIVVDGRVWGSINVATTEDEPFAADAEERLARFTELVATAVSNATIRADLIASRARVVAAADDTRRRIERDLHDGAQQQLVTLALGLRSAQARVPDGLEDLKTEVGRFADRLSSVIDELREMSRGIHPAVLTKGGLAPAVEALARRSAIPVDLNVRCERRLADKIEVAAYYVISEALTNAAKHAEASRVEIDLEVGEETLCLAVRDDGVGGADPAGGSGLIGLKDRVEALGGMIVIASPPGGGTRLDVEIPLLTGPSIGSDPGQLSAV